MTATRAGPLLMLTKRICAGLENVTVLVTMDEDQRLYILSVWSTLKSKDVNTDHVTHIGRK